MIRHNPTKHSMFFHRFPPTAETTEWWEMYCSCGAWQHGSREQVEHTAAVHRAERGESAP